MVRLSDLHADERNKMLQAAPGLPQIDPAPWISPPPLADATVAIITTSGIHSRQDPPFRPGLGEYRIIPADIDPAELTMSHISVNFDRSAFQQDPNVWFPLDRLREMKTDGDRWRLPLALCLHGRDPDPDADGADSQRGWTIPAR
ncbi:MAG: glycine/sarcosine/betaine reductase selenoprotein B family protein [Acidimicrobiia bacterium]|nr:glycine/sarcosine/betaine reductase selenoprotein B family protein [Acidimicrobiia bacterium]